MDIDAKFVASSMSAGVRCAGTAEFAGLDALPDYRRSQIFVRLAERLFPNINTIDTIEWMGSRPSFPDSLPCLGEVPEKRVFSVHLAIVIMALEWLQTQVASLRAL